MNKYIFTMLLAALCALPIAAQVSNGGTNHERPARKVNQAVAATPAKQKGQNNARLNAQVERTVANATQQAQHPASCACPCHQTDGQSDEPEIPVIFTQEEGELSTRELIAAEEELALIRNQKDDKDTFEKYPYLLDPAYRRAGNTTQKSHIRTHYGKDKPGQFTPSYSHGEAWARKVGL